MISLQTNVTSLQAQQDLNINNQFQSNTIQQLSSGYRINSSADDAAGLAVANQYTSDTVELQQGVRNANDGLSQLQIVDGGLSNISNMLNRMKTLATESATSTFTGNRTTLNNEYQDLVSEITRQASDIQLNAGGNLNKALTVYIGGGRTSNQAGSSSVTVNLAGSSNAVDANSLGLNNTTLLGGGTGSTSFNGNNVRNLNNPGATFLSGNGTETFNISYVNGSGVVTPLTVTVTGSAGGISGTAAIAQINNGLGGTGISAQIGSNGDLQFSGSSLLTAMASSSSVTRIVMNGATLVNSANYRATSGLTPFVPGDTGPTTETVVVSVGGAAYNVTLDSSTSGNTAADTAAHAVASLNSQLQGSGVYASANGNSITLQSASAFNIVETGNTPGQSGGAPVQFTFNAADAGNQTAAVNSLQAALGADGFTVTADGVGGGITITAAGSIPADVFSLLVNSVSNPANGDYAGVPGYKWVNQLGGNGAWYNDSTFIPFSGGATESVTYTPGIVGSGSLFGATPGAFAVTAPTNSTSSAGVTGNAQNAIAAINSAVTSLGAVQGAVGAGENTLNYAISLAQSQITNFSAAQSQIKDADIASQAANLTKAQVLQQASIAAMAQANSSPQAVLKLLQ